MPNQSRPTAACAGVPPRPLAGPPGDAARWEHLHAAAPAPPEAHAAAKDEAYADGDPFEDDRDEERASAAATSAAGPCLLALGAAMGCSAGEGLRHCLYPHGSMSVTTDEDEHLGLQLDPTPAATETFTVHRDFGGGAYDVVVFDAQPRTTLVCFPASSRHTDIAVGLRGRALLRHDIDWCERDLDLDL